MAMMDLMKARLRQSYMDDGRPPLTDDDAALLVDRRGLMLLGADSGLGLPSLSAADDDREWSVSWRAWRWKETLPAAHRCAYLKWFRGQGTFVAWHILPSLYSLWGPDRLAAESRDGAWQSGRLGRTELAVLAAIEELGPVSSRELWQQLRWQPAFGGRRGVLLGALTALQKGLFVSVAGGDLEGWSMHHWDLLPRLVPDGLLDRLPCPADAQTTLVLCAVDNLVAATPREVARLFGWGSKEATRVLDSLVESGQLRGDLIVGRGARAYGRLGEGPQRLPSGQNC